MPGPVRVPTVIDVTWGSMTRGREISKEAEKLFGAAAASGIEKGTQEAVRKSGAWLEVKKQMRKASLEGVEKIEQQLIQAEVRKRKFQEEAEKAARRAASTLSADERKREERAFAAFERRAKAESRYQENIQEKMRREAEERIEMFEEANRRMQRTSAERAEEFGENFEKAIQTAMSPENLDFKDLARGISSGLSQGLKGAAGKAQVAGMDPKLVAALGTAAASIAAVAGPLAVLVGVMVAATDQARAMNESFLSAATAADIVGAGTQRFEVAGATYTEVGVALKGLRRAAIEVADAMWMSKEEVVAAIGAINEAGLAVRDFTRFVGEGTHPFQAYADVARTAIVASKALGVSTSEVGEFATRAFKDLGFSLYDVQGAFGTIRGAAVRAGMTTKDFFAAINQASTGMALMSFRIEDTIGLFEDMVKILGEDLAKEQIALQGQFRGMGMQERVKTTMLTGPVAGTIARANAKAQGKAFAEQFGDIEGLGSLADPKTLERLGGMKGEEFRKIYRNLEDKNPAAARQLVTLQNMSKSMQGGLMAVAESLPSLNKQGELAMQLSTGMALTGGRPISELDPTTQMMLQETQGVSAEQFEVLKRLDIGLRTEFERLREQGDPAVQGKTFLEAVADGTLSQSEEMKEAAKQQYSLMEQSALDQLSETQTIKDVLMNKIAGLLETIYNGIEHLGKLVGLIPGVGGGAVGKQAEEVIKAREREKEVAKEQADAIEKASEEMRSLQETLRTTEDLEEKKKLREQMEEKSKSLERMRLGRDATEGRLAYLSSLGAGEKVDERALREAGLKAAGMSPEEIKSTAQYAMGTYVGEDGNRYIATTLESQTERFIEGNELDREKIAEDKKSQEINEKLLEGGFEDVVKTLRELDERQAQRQLAMIFGTEEVAAALQSPEGAQALVNKAMEGGLSEAEAMLLARAGIDMKGYDYVKGSAALGEGRVGVSPMGVDDFIYQGDASGGRVTPINSQDEFVGMKPGGPVAQAMGGGKSVTVNINGGDEARVYSVVKRVLTETGYGDRRSY
jgi:hypothetical protein